MGCAIAELVCTMVAKHVPLTPEPDFNPVREGSTVRFCELPPEWWVELVAMKPDHGEVVCRCEQVTKQEILDAVYNPLGAHTMASIKYRTRAGQE